MGCILINDFIKAFCYDNLSLENKIKYLDSLEDSVTLVYKGYTFDEMVEAVKENRDLKREIELLQGQVSYYEDKLEERSYSEEALDDLEKEYAELKKTHDSIMNDVIFWKDKYADYDTLKKTYDSIRDDIYFWKDKYEEACREAKKYIKQNESIRKENQTLQANIDILNNNIRLQEVTKRDEVLDAIFDILCDFYGTV